MRILLIASFVLISTAAPAATVSLEDTVTQCGSCHGAQGRSEQPEIPSLGGQPPLFLQIELHLFRQGTRMKSESSMNEFAKGMSDADLKQLADLVSKLPPPNPANGAADATRMERGRTLAVQHKCGYCHQPDFSGQAQMPQLAGQREDYLLKALRDYKSGLRPGYEPMMAMVLYPLKDTEIHDLAYYLARFSGPSAAGGARPGTRALPLELR